MRAVISALAYDEGEIEVVVVDDHSAIPARKALSKISDFRLKIIEMQSGRTGVSAARNYGLDHASGQILMFLDDDDEFVEGYLQLVASLDLDQFDFGCAAYSRKCQAACNKDALANSKVNCTPGATCHSHRFS